MRRFRFELSPVFLAIALSGCGGDAVIPLPAKFTSISAGVLHSCGLVGDGAAYCWGYNERGQLGDGSRSTRKSPVGVLGDLRFTALDAGGQHTCGITSGGKVYCWGMNLSGQLGDNSNTDRATPAAITGTASFQAISAAGAYTCGLVSGGAALCWGWNESGQLGDGSTADRRTPTGVSGGLVFATVAAAVRHSCGVTTGGEVYCWGVNDNGQLGNGEIDPSPTPVKVLSSVGFRSVDVGFYHTCALATDGRLFCWGANTFGQLGLGADASAAPRLTPVEVVGGRRYASVSAGAAFTCAIEQGTGTAYCWGFNESGQLGSEPADRCVDEQQSYACTLDPTPVGGGLSFAAISANTQHVCGLTTDGIAYCWGSASDGQLGDGSKGQTLIRIEPVKVLGQP